MSGNFRNHFHDFVVTFFNFVAVLLLYIIIWCANQTLKSKILARCSVSASELWTQHGQKAYMKWPNQTDHCCLSKRLPTFLCQVHTRSFGQGVMCQMSFHHVECVPESINFTVQQK